MNFEYKVLSTLLISLALINLGVSASVHGSVYRWNDLEEVPAMVKALQNGEIVTQKLANSTGQYQLELDPGNYTVQAVHNNLTAEQSISLSFNDSKRIDLALTVGEDYIFPDSGEIPEYEGIYPPEENLQGNETGNATGSKPIGGKEEPGEMTIYLSVFTALVLIALTYFLKKKGERVLKEKTHIPSDEEKVMDKLKEMGGEAYQGDVREETGFSASKTSELLSRMEEKKLIEREKKGRQKVVRLK